MDGQEHSAVPMHSQLAVSMWISKHNVRISVYTEITAFLCWDLMNILRIHLCDFLAQNYDEERVMAPEIIMNYYYTHFRPIANIYICFHQWSRPDPRICSSTICSLESKAYPGAFVLSQVSSINFMEHNQDSILTLFKLKSLT